MKRSRSYYEGIWTKVLLPQISELIQQKGVSCSSLDAAKEEIWRCYLEQNKHCSECYMESPTAPLDRHKTAACYMYAVVEASPLCIDESVDMNDDAYMANEMLAVVLGCSVLDAYSRVATQESDLDNDQKMQVLKRLENGIEFDSLFPVGHGGTYFASLLSCLCFTGIEGNYNILMLALLLYHWELAIVGRKDWFERIIMVRNAQLVSMADEGGAEWS